MGFQGGAVRVKQDFTDNKEQLLEVVQTLVFGEDKDGDGIPDTLEEGTAFGQDDAEFTILNTDRQLSALQTAVAMLRPLPDQKSLVYFASGLRLNGVDNQAQLRATTNAALRANVSHLPGRRARARGAARRSATRRGRRRAGVPQCSPGRRRASAGQLPAVAGHAVRAREGHGREGDVRLQRPVAGHRAGGPGDHELLHHRLLQHAHGARRQVPPREDRARRESRRPSVTYRQGYFADKEFAKFTAADKERQLEDALMLENPITEITIAMEVNYFQLNRAEYFIPVAVKIPGSELALARRRGRAADAARLHRRGEGRLRHHHPERARQAGYQADATTRRRSSPNGPSSTRPGSRCCRASTSSSSWRATPRPGASARSRRRSRFRT